MEVKQAIELYNFFIKEGYDLGSQENFLGSFQDDKLRVELFNFFSEVLAHRTMICIPMGNFFD